MPPSVTLRVGVISHRIVHLGCQYHTLALFTVEGFTHNDLTAPATKIKVLRIVPVDVGGIHKIDTAFDRLIDNTQRLGFALPAPKIHATQTKGADFHPSAPQALVFHRISFLALT